MTVSASNVHAGTPQIYLNNSPLRLLTSLPLEFDGKTFVPLKEIAPYLGADVALPNDLSSATLKWGLSQETTLDASDLYVRVGLVYVDLSKLVQILGARLQALDGKIYLYTTQAELKILSGIGDQLSFVFSQHVPYRLEQRGATLKLIFYNALTHRALPTLASRRIRSVQGEAQDLSMFAVTVYLNDAAEYDLSEFSTASGFSLWIRFGAVKLPSLPQPTVYPQQPQSTVWLDAHTTYNQSRVLTSGGIVRIHYLKVQDYRSNYWLQVGLPLAGIGTLSSLDDMTRAHGAFAAINANFFDPNSGHPVGLLVKDSFPVSQQYGQRAALLIDFLGKVNFANPTLQLSFKAFGKTLPIEGLNRPLKRDELVLYTSDYSKNIRSELPIRAVQVRSGKVIRVNDGYVASNDPGSMLLVASGSARSRLAGLRPADEVEVSYKLTPKPDLLLEAVSAGPMLIRDGQIILDPRAEGFTPQFATMKAARSAVGVTPNGDLILLIALRGDGSVGADLTTLAQIMSQLGAQDAMALDGGGSSGLAFHKGISLETVGGDRPIAAALMLLPKK
ncbi:phosphodiester glycosidase family protein [Candidatus Acetothermia bacterium]|nr:phosphodiester glycosidase family protein [Candidatus Acetothermia bacterium]MBI3460458.1 phosphodiester glycosidase family protein [Candidatus Acetothermia bacterium]MBI3660924.1 phosphodiester glycosidase family protein [Candidatus Acetothermia bacterium]